VKPSSIRGRHALAALTLAVLCAACGEPSAPAGLEVTVTTSRATAAPGEAILVTVRAEPLGANTVRWITLATTGLIVTRDSIAVTGAGPQELVRTLVLPLSPITGKLTISGAASVGANTVTDQATVDVSDETAPSIVTFVAEPVPAEPGDSTHFNFDVRDAVGLSRIVVRVDSAFVGEHVLTFDPPVQRAAGTLKIKVPNDIIIGPRARATITAFDESGHFRQASLTYTIRDTRPPVARFELGGLHADLTIGTGETIQVIANVTDNHLLTYIGYRGDGRRDSVAVGGPTSATRHAFPLVVPAAWRQRRPAFSVWARDVSGNISPVSHDAVGTLPVYDWTDVPKAIIPFPDEPTPVDLVWDSRRSVVYLLRADFEGIRNSSIIDVIQIPSGQLIGSIAVGPNAVGLSLTTSGDSLITTLPAQKALGVVDLTKQQRTLALIPLQHVDQDRYLGGARLSGSHVFVPIIHGLYAGRLLDVNLATGTQTIRADIGGTADLTQYPMLLPLPANRLLLHRETDSYSRNDTFLYNLASDTFDAIPSLPPIGQYSRYSSSLTGRLMIGSKVFNDAFVEIDSVGTQDWLGHYSNALSVDGESVYLATWHGYQKVRVTDGFILEQVNLEMYIGHLLLLPDGNTLIAVGSLPGTNKGEYCLMVIDLR
jgi:hypothetical protein